MTGRDWTWVYLLFGGWGLATALIDVSWREPVFWLGDVFIALGYAARVLR